MDAPTLICFEPAFVHRDFSIDCTKNAQEPGLEAKTALRGSVLRAISHPDALARGQPAPRLRSPSGPSRRLNGGGRGINNSREVLRTAPRFAQAPAKLD
jgi:hypothetical protein